MSFDCDCSEHSEDEPSKYEVTNTEREINFGVYNYCKKGANFEISRGFSLVSIKGDL